jgi:fatty aldehyde-generating acyl-ACP reductase
MKFATLSHLFTKENLKFIPKEWIQNDIIVSPEIDVNETKGYIISLNLTAKEVMKSPREKIRKKILDAALFAQDKLNVEIIQLGALTTSVTSGGIWLTNQDEYKGYVTHGDSYTAAVTCQAIDKILELKNKDFSDFTFAVVGAYGIIGEAVSKIMTPKFKHTILIGRRSEKLKELETKINGDFETSINLKTEEADVIVTATSHPTALLQPRDLKKNAIIIDVSQPPNLSIDVCKKRLDIQRIDGGYVNFPYNYSLPIPGLPHGKIYACFAELIMQALEGDKQNHVGSIDSDFLYKTEEWGKKYNFILEELTNFGKKIK